MNYAVTDLAVIKYGYNNFEIVMPGGVKGRYVYAHLMAGGDIFVREFEVFAPFAYGQ